MAGRYASAGLIIIMALGVCGIVLISVLVMRVPNLFQPMPRDLLAEARSNSYLLGVATLFVSHGD